MPIRALSGLPRQGKSYNAVKEIILHALEQGRVVATNIPLFEDEIRKYCKTGTIINWDAKEPVIVHDDGTTSFNYKFFNDYERFPKGCVHVIDEVTRYWPAGLKAEKMHIQDRNFFTEHGHLVGENGYTTEIYLVVQDLDMVARFVRNLVEETWIVTKLKRVGLSGMYRVDVWPKARLLSKTGGKPDNSWQRPYDKKVFAMYRSHTHSDSGAAGVERDVRSSSVLGKVVLKLSVYLAAFAVAMWFMASSLGMDLSIIFGGDDVDAAPEPTAREIDDSKPSGAPKSLAASGASPASNGIISGKFLEPSREETLIIIGQMAWDTGENMQHIFLDPHGYYLTSSDLIQLGYQLEPINNCLVNVTDPLGHTLPIRCALKTVDA